MNIGTITQNASGTYTGKISTLTVAIVIALRTVHSANPRAPKFEILALSAARQWVRRCRRPQRPVHKLSLQEVRRGRRGNRWL